MWICRAGKNACYIEQVKENNKIYLFWDGYGENYSSYESLSEFRQIVEDEKGNVSKTAISNWAAQLYAFCISIQIGEYILIPYFKAQKYMLVKVTGKYEYNENEVFRHSRSIKIIKDNIPKNIFPKEIVFSLNAFRTIYRVKNEKEIIDIINKI